MHPAVSTFSSSSVPALSPSPMATPSAKGAIMSGASSNQVRSKADQSWSDLIDLDGLGRFFKIIYPVKTAERVAALTGYPVTTVRKWLSGEASPNGKAVFALVLTFGPELISATVPQAPAWLSHSVRDEQTRALTAEIDARRARLAALRP